MIQAFPLRALVVLTLFLGAVFAINTFVGAPRAEASLADEIICDVFTELNELGEPIPDLNHDGCPDVEPPPPPPPPSCNEGEHLEGETCVPDTTDEEENGGGGDTNTNPPVENPAPTGGGGSGAPSFVPPPSSGAAAVVGEVLGAATTTEAVLGESCGIYMSSYLRMGSPKNDSAQVEKLQNFLNKNMQANLPVTGYFGALTHAAVKAFQAAHADTILTPWGSTEPTGLVYLTTAYQINLIECPSLTLSLPSLVPWSENPAI